MFATNEASDNEHSAPGNRNIANRLSPSTGRTGTSRGRNLPRRYERRNGTGVRFAAQFEGVSLCGLPKAARLPLAIGLDVRYQGAQAGKETNRRVQLQKADFSLR